MATVAISRDLIVFGLKIDGCIRLAGESHVENPPTGGLDLLTGDGAEIPKDVQQELEKFKLVQPKILELPRPPSIAVDGPKGVLERRDTPPAHQKPKPAQPQPTRPPSSIIRNVTGYSGTGQRVVSGIQQQKASVFDPAIYFVAAMQRYKCPARGCNKSFETPGRFAGHVKSATHQRKDLQCPSCYRWFDSRFSLAQHCASENKRCDVGGKGHQAFYTQLMEEFGQSLGVSSWSKPFAGSPVRQEEAADNTRGVDGSEGESSETPVVW